MKIKNLVILVGATFGMIGVALGSFGAHILKNNISDALLSTFETAIRYQMYHALVLLFIGLTYTSNKSIWLNYSAKAFTIGVLLFSGSLYLFVFTSNTLFAMITPIGGFTFLLGWFCLVIHSVKIVE